MINTEQIYAYSTEHSSPQGDLLYRLNRETHLKTLAPRMISGALQGRILSLISHLVCPETIIEIGTFTGYSALCLAEGLHPQGKLYTIDVDPEYSSISQKYFDESSYKEQILPIIGDAKTVIPSIDVPTIDLVFMDAKKRDYPAYYDLVLPRLKKGGLILADNILWSGKVLEENPDKTTRVIQEFNRHVAEDSRVENVILPIRDGINVIRKL